MTAASTPEVAWWRTLLPMTRPYRWRLVGMAGLVTASSAAALATPWPIKVAIDSVLQDREPRGVLGWVSDVPGAAGATGQLIMLAVVMLGLYLVRFVLDGTLDVLRRVTGQRMTFDLSARMLGSIQARSMAAMRAQSTGDQVQRIVNDARCLELFSVIGLLGLFSAVIMLVAMFIVSATLNVWLAVAAFGGALPSLLVMRLYLAPMGRHASRKADAEGRVATEAERAIGSIVELQVFGAQPRARREFDCAGDDRLEASLALQRTYFAYESSVGLFTALGAAIVLIVGGFQVLSGHASVGALIVVSTYVAGVSGPLASLAQILQGVVFARALSLRAIAVLGDDDNIREVARPRELPARARGAAVELRDVSFRYGADLPLVLRGIDLVIEPGELVAFVGASGAGKSTLASLLPRFADPTHGSVRIDGVDLREARVRQVRERVAVVHQETVLLPLSVAENIAFGAPHASIHDIRAAAEAANAAEFIDRLPEGYDTVLGQRGATLSGGQQQRLALARAFLKDAALVVLDEPTSALDAASEAKVVDALQRRRDRSTLVVIAHRLSTVRTASRVVVLDEGRIVEQGRHDELLAQDGAYARLCRLQFAEVGHE